MSWPENRRSLLAGLSLLALGPGLAGCGFRPLYGAAETPAWDAEMASIKVEPIPERIGQLIANSLRDNFNPTRRSMPLKYQLKVTLTLGRSELGIRKDATSSRAQYVVTAVYVLSDYGAPRPLTSGSVRSTTTFDILDNQEYATLIAEQDALAHAAREISLEVQTKVGFFLQRRSAAS